ncbi:MAG: carboxypeptidase regulatory-like domain-containing protein, partial [Acidobacteriia bacterium]|nr:carboxypeptidase regulatory-like domain-containing protein [Terriglobia bacterium]
MLLAIGFSCFPAWGQTFQGSITGTVSDPSGAIIPGATVTAREQGTGLTRSVSSLDDGTYEIALLPPRIYELTAEKPGFARMFQGPINLTVNQHLKVDLQMKLGAQSTTVAVKGAPPVVETQNSSVGTTVGQVMANEVPLNGRHFLQLALLVPGVVPGTPGSRISDRGGAINVNGLQESMNSYWLDGLDDTAIGVGQFTVVPPLDSILQLRMETGGYDAKFGAHAGAQVNIVTKSGTNQFHGSLHEYLRNSSLDARSFFDPTVPPSRRNQFGGALGGPFKLPGVYDGRDRTFFFVLYEGLRDRRSFFNRARVPTLAERSGDFAADLAPDCPVQTLLINPFALFGGQVQPFTNINKVLPGGPDPAGQALVNLYPRPNIPGATCGGVNYIAQVNRKVDMDNFFGRVDQRWGSTDNLFFRYNVNFDREVLPPNTSSRAAQTNVPGYGTSTHDAYQMAGLDWTHIFTPTLFNELKLGYNRWQIRETTEDQGNTLAQQLGIQGITTTNATQIGVPILNFAGYDSLGANNTDPQRGAVNTFQAADTVTHVYGNHSLAYGVDLRSVERGNFTIDSVIRGEFDFTGLVTGGFGQLPPGAGQLLSCVSPNCVLGSGVADALLGLPTFWLNGFEQNISGHLGEYDFFGQDTWKVRSNLTLILGIRYEYKGLSTDKYDRFSNFDFGKGLLLVAGKKVVTQEAYDPNTGLFVPVGNGSLGSTGENRSLQHPDKDDFAPRFGFTWQPFHNSRTVLRGGYGVFYNQTFGDVFFQKGANPPFVRLSAGNISAVQPALAGGELVPGSGAVIQGALAGLVGPFFPNVSPFQLDFQDGLIHEWNFDVQHEFPRSWLLDVGYVGTRGLRLPRETDPNQPRPDPLTQTALAPYPYLSGFSYTQSSGRSSYHALQMKVERHYSNGLAILGGYTFSKSIDTNSNAFTTSRDPNFPQNSMDLAAEKALSDFDVRHRL